MTQISAKDVPGMGRRQFMNLLTFGSCAGVALGALGAHGLKATLIERGMTVAWDSAARYHLFQAIALLALAAWERAKALIDGQVQQPLLGFHLSIGNVQTGLQAANGDVGVCSLRGNGQSGGGPIRLGRLILGERGFACASQPAKPTQRSLV